MGKRRDTLAPAQKGKSGYSKIVITDKVRNVVEFGVLNSATIDQIAAMLGTTRGRVEFNIKSYRAFRELFERAEDKLRNELMENIVKLAKGFTIRQTKMDAEGNIKEVVEKEVPPDKDALMKILPKISKFFEEVNLLENIEIKLDGVEYTKAIDEELKRRKFNIDLQQTVNAGQ